MVGWLFVLLSYHSRVLFCVAAVTYVLYRNTPQANRRVSFLFHNAELFETNDKKSIPNDGKVDKSPSWERRNMSGRTPAGRIFSIQNNASSASSSWRYAVGTFGIISGKMNHEAP